MKQLIRVALLAAAGTASAGAALAAGFTGPTAPANFSVSNTGTLTGSSTSLGSATFSATQLVLTGSDTSTPDGSPGCSGGSYAQLSSPCQLQATIALPGVYQFDWAYASADADGPPGDIFGVIVDGTRIALSSPGKAITQNGSNAFTASSSFGWFLNCTDCLGGAATAVVSNFTLSPVPEPATSALLLGGAGLLGVALRRRRR